MKNSNDLIQPDFGYIRLVKNFQLKKSDCESPRGRSLTVPDQAIGIRELLAKHTRGLLDGSMYRPGLYDEDPDLDDLDRGQFVRLDPVEQSEIREAHADRLSTLRENQKQKLAERKKTLSQTVPDGDENSSQEPDQIKPVKPEKSRKYDGKKGPPLAQNDGSQNTSEDD